jgi:hypothetical protein
LIEAQRLDHIRLSGSLNDLSSKYIDMKSKIESTQLLASLSSDNYNALKNQMNQGLSAFQPYVDQQIKSSIASIPKPEMPDLDAPLKAMQQQFEPARLDAANAKLRAENNEKKIVILEKKVEQLQLLLNKLQLQG